MKKLLVPVLIVALLFSGCAMGLNVCDKLSQQDTVRYQTTLQDLQDLYPAVQGLVPLIPYAGPILAATIPIIVGLADSTLHNLGVVLATNCQNGQTLTLAQAAIKTIQAFISSADVQQQLKVAGVAKMKAIR